MQNRPFQCPFDDVLYASALLRSGDSATAAAEFDKLLEQGEPDSEETYVLAALAHQRSADAARAVEICERGLLAYPYSERIEGIYLRLPAPLIQARIEARLAALNGKVEAMTSLVRDIDNWPASAPSLVSTAEALLKRAVLAAPKNARARYEYGRCLGLQRRLAEAVAALEEALSLTSDADLRVRIQTRLAAFEEQQSHLESAAQRFHAAMDENRSLKKHDAASACEYAQFLERQSQSVQAAAVLMEILHWDPFYVPAHLERAILFAREARWPDVIGEAAFVTRNADDTTMLRTAHSFLARAFHGTSQDRKARTEELWIEAH